MVSTSLDELDFQGGRLASGCQFAVTPGVRLIRPAPSPGLHRPEPARMPAMSTWELTITPASADGLPLFLRIARAVVGDIRRGRLRPGDSLPGSRTLARTLGVNRNTVLSSYRELLAEGWVATTPAGSTFVSRDLPTNGYHPRPLPAAHRGIVGFPIAPPLTLDHPPGYPPGTLVLAKGAPDVRLLHTPELARAFRRAMAREGRALLSYGDLR